MNNSLLLCHADWFTDSHEIFGASRRLISGPRRRYAGVIIDVLYDHIPGKRPDHRMTHFCFAEAIAFLTSSLIKRRMCS